MTASKSQTTYRRLDPVNRFVMQIIAITDGTMTWHAVHDLIKNCDWVKPTGGRLLNADLRTSIQSLEREGLLRPTPLGTWNVAPEIIDEPVQDAIRAGHFEKVAKAMQEAKLRRAYYGHDRRDEARDLRLAFYSGDVAAFRSGAYYPGYTERAHLLEPFALDIFRELDPELRRMYLLDVIPRQILSPRGDRALVDAFIATTRDIDYTQADARLIGSWLDLAVARGDLDDLRRLDEFTRGKFEPISGCLALLTGDYDRAEELLGAALPVERKGAKKQALLALRHLPLPLYLLLLFRRRSSHSLARARRMIHAATQDGDGRYADLIQLLDGTADTCEKPMSNAWFGSLLRDFARTPFGKLVAGYVAYWTLEEPDLPNTLGGLSDYAEAYRKAGLSWLADEAATLAPLVSRAARPATFDSTVSPGVKSLVQAVAREPAWRRALAAIVDLAQTDVPGAKADAKSVEERVVWQLYTAPDHFTLEAHAQKRTRKGWSAGRKIAAATLLEKQDSDELEFLSPQDRAIIATMREQTEQYFGYPRKKVVLDQIRAARALIGHPAVFHVHDRETPLEVFEQPVKLIVTKHDDRLRMRLDPPPENVGSEEPVAGECLVANETGVVRLVPDGPHRLGVVLYSAKHRKLQDMLRGELDVPAEGAEQVVESLQALSSLVAVHSEVGDTLPTLSSIPADPRPQLHLVPHQGGLRIEPYVRPFGEDGPFCRAGQGGANVFATIDGRPLSAVRDLVEETRLLGALQSECPFLSSEGPSILPTPVESLEAVLQLDRLRAAERVVLHWPQGGTMRVAGEVSTSAFRVQIKKDREWFAATGTLEVDADLAIDMMKLIELVEGSSSRFVQLDDGRFLALTDQLRRRVSEMASFGEAYKSKLRFPGVRAAAWEDLGDIQFKADEHWRNCVQRMRDASAVVAEIPSTLQAELRDYQKAGYQWLSSLAAWGVGGCLADDMGLGKTVQSIALLLQRSAGGPALVVAPTSVAFNWVKEVERFAPTLTVKLFGVGDREAFFQGLGPREVVVTSYGLLHNEAERFQQQRWHTAILDEAQAIKNMATRRSQAAMGLEADFRLIMTGTPLENHLGELWNLFQFINPGLLGSHEMFQQRFAQPIERDHCPDTRRRLKKLIQPFMLRRTKTQVLTELPSRTELTLQVELSSEEAAFYEALRISAMKKLEGSDEGPRGGQHLRILAEIMRLRRACCHPKLAVADCGLSSAKLTLFSETIDELLANNHKALVFSQFVDHLSILREELERKNISYQYLDGSTPAKDRKTRVEAFQAGEGDVFLISLKAGGIGLNLTAADYVLHMDPWWNPAVEDQASDRAHRMGQLRPVTIYRFITKGTIEERITDLHASKRDLADSLLEGADVSGKLTADELLKLIRE